MMKTKMNRMTKNRILIRKISALLLSASMILTPAITAFGADTTEYEAVMPQYRYDPDAKTPAVDKLTSASRFEKGSDGIYRNPDAKDTGEATLMITGDLMCQFRQQLAAFTSDGTDYIDYDEFVAIKEKAVEEQENAKKEILLGGSGAISGSGSSGQGGSNGSSGGGASYGSASDDSDEMLNGDEEDDEAEGEDNTASSSMSIPALDFGVLSQPSGSWNFDDSFDYVRDVLKRGDLVIGNLETMISQSSPLGMQCRRLEGRPYLNSPVEFLGALKGAGYDLLTLANNHDCDTGVQGVFETLENVDRYGFMRTGLFADEDEERYLIVEVNGIKIGIVSYATYFNTKDANFTALGQEILLNRFTTDKAREDIRAARKAGAEFVIAFMHWGKENTNETTERQERYARNVARAGADYIVGSHPHALQRADMIELSNGRQIPVIYSMGNFLSCMKLDVNNDALILKLKLKRNSDGEVEVASHRLYPCTIMEDLEVTDEDNKASTLDYVIVPHKKDLMPILSGKTLASREDLAYLASSLSRILPVYGGRLLLALPYDPYGFLDDDGRFTMFYLKNHIKWLMENDL